MLLLAMERNYGSRINSGIRKPSVYVEFDQSRFPKDPYPNRKNLDKPNPDKEKEIIVVVIEQRP